MKEPKIKVLHISHAKSFEDGGIYSAVKKIIESHEISNISTEWISTKNLAKKELIELIKKINPSMIHIHGLWRLPTRRFIIKNISIPFMISPHGMLSEWSLKQSFLNCGLHNLN